MIMYVVVKQGICRDRENTIVSLQGKKDLMHTTVYILKQVFVQFFHQATATNSKDINKNTSALQSPCSYIINCSHLKAHLTCLNQRYGGKEKKTKKQIQPAH